MKTIKPVLGYLWAGTTLFIVLATFFGHSFFSRLLAQTTGLHIHPRFSGGEIRQTIDYKSFTTAVHRPVFDGIWGCREEGFVQINWSPADGLPGRVLEPVDYDGDGDADLTLSLDTGTGQLKYETTNPQVLGTEGPFRLKDGWAARVLLKRSGRQE